MTTTTTTPNEFLQFAKDLGLDQMKTTSETNTNGYSLTGLSVLNNLCHLIEQIHTLKVENDHLRAHLELIQHIDKFSSKHEEKKDISIYDEEKSSTLSPSNSLKIKNYSSATLSTSSRERQGVDIANHPEDSSSMMHIESDMIDNNLGLSSVPSWNNWSKVRHALKFSLRRKAADPPPTSPIGPIPAISISVESDDDHLQDNKNQKKKKKILTTNYHLTGEDTDHDDESIELHQKRYQGGNSPCNETNLSTEDEHLLARKHSKIAHYRRKLRSKLNTVKRQFSDQNVSSTSRLFPPTPTSPLEDLGSGFNHALLTVQLAPAMTKSYQQKMREWHSMQKSNFLVDYRRQSIAIKTELNTEPRKTSLISTINEISDEEQVQSPNESIPNTKPDVCPTLSPNQRSLIVHQWREIMSEEISLRIHSEYLHKKLQELNQLETDLKSLKMSIFSTNNQEYVLKHRSMTSIDQLDQDILDQYRQTYLPQRCRSYQSLISMPASWILAVRSAAYSDILDGTSNKTTDRAIIFNKDFFNQLNHFKNDRANFEQNTFKNLPISTNSMANILYEENFNEKRSMRTRTRTILTRGHLRKLSLIFPSEIPPNNPMISIQTITANVENSSHIDLLTSNEIETNLPSTTVNKRFKRSRFDLKKTLQRSKSMCMTQFHSWLQRRRQQQQQQQNSSVHRRKSAIESKSNTPSCSTPKLLGSPRLARLHQRLFKQHPSSRIPLIEESSLSPPASSSSQLDDSDQYFKKQESPVRIYLPARTPPTTRHVRIIDNEIKTPPMSKITSPIVNRRKFPSIKITTARERRESYAALSNILNNQ